MTAQEEAFPDHGDSSKWASLDQEETRCLEGLRDYWVKIEGKAPKEGLEKAWIDLKKEFPRLKVFTWYME